jgi:hypothetical protein
MVLGKPRCEHGGIGSALACVLLLGQLVIVSLLISLCQLNLGGILKKGRSIYSLND